MNTRPRYQPGELHIGHADLDEKIGGDNCTQKFSFYFIHNIISKCQEIRCFQRYFFPTNFKFSTLSFIILFSSEYNHGYNKKLFSFQFLVVF